MLQLPNSVAVPSPAAPELTTSESTIVSSPITSVSSPTTDSPNSSSKSPSTLEPSSALQPYVETHLTPGEEWPKDTNLGSPEFYSSDHNDSSYQPSNRVASDDVDDILTNSDHYLEVPLYPSKTPINISDQEMPNLPSTVPDVSVYRSTRRVRPKLTIPISSMPSSSRQPPVRRSTRRLASPPVKMSIPDDVPVVPPTPTVPLVSQPSAQPDVSEVPPSAATDAPPAPATPPT